MWRSGATALMAFLLEAMPAIIWDNIERGAKLRCLHIERAWHEGDETV